MFILFFKLHVAVKRISQKPLSRLQLDSTSPPHTEETEGRREKGEGRMKLRYYMIAKKITIFFNYQQDEIIHKINKRGKFSFSVCILVLNKGKISTFNIVL